MASFLVDLGQLQRLIVQIESMQHELRSVMTSLRASRLELETTWQGGSPPTHVSAEMDRIARSIAENTEALDRLSQALQQINDAYKSTDAQISQTFG